MSGQLVDGKYRVLSTLGQGGMGTVFMAEHTGTGRRVALKVIAPEAMLSQEFVSRFQREARAVGAIDTQHIVQVFDTGRDPATGAPFIAMELLAGCDLDNLLERVRALHVEVALRVVFQACLGLAKAHAANVVHRDIKPANIFLATRDAGEVIVKILDFGVAKVMAEKAHSNVALTDPGGVLGSPAYMSPEQARGLSTVDHRTDVWSLGVVLYEALAGTTPFLRTSLGECIAAICAEDPIPVERLAPGTPPEVAAIVRRALERNPADRFQTAAQMIEAMEPLLRQGWSLNQRMFEGTFTTLDIPTSLTPVSSKPYSFAPATALTPPLTILNPRLQDPRSDPAPAGSSLAPSDSNRSDSNRGVDALELAATQALAKREELIEPIDDTSRLLNQTLANRYTLVRLVGMGGMGAVYEAVDAEGGHYALKVILPDVALRSTDAIKRFVLEARAGLRLQSDYITQMVEAGHDEARKLPFIVMELLTGIDIGRHVSASGPMSPDVAAAIFRQACLGLQVAHDLGMIHRDIKPENVFLHQAADGKIVPKLCDFGIAKQDGSLEELRATALTRTGSMLGSPMYMSPEQAENPRRADVRSDIWSMGISLYEALCGRPAWEGSTTVGELLLRLYTKDVPPIQDVAPWIEPQLAEVVHTALRRDPKARYKSARDFADALAPFGTRVELRKTTVLSVPPDTMRRVATRASRAATSTGVNLASTPPPPTPAHSSGRALRMGAGALVLMTAAIGVFLYRTTHVEPVAPPQPGLAAPATVALPAAQEQTVAAVTIRPKSATVTVDGRPVVLDDGLLRLERRPGTTALVRVVQGERSIERTVVITNNGTTLPSQLELPGEPLASSGPVVSIPHAPSPPKGGGHGAHPPSSSAPADSPAPAASPAPSASTPRLKTTW